MAKKKVSPAPLSDRPFCVGNDETRAYLGGIDEETFRKNYLAVGLRPVVREGKLYYFKEDITTFLRKNDQYKEPTPKIVIAPRMKEKMLRTGS